MNPSAPHPVPDPLEVVRSSCRRVVDLARHVQIDPTALEALARQIGTDEDPDDAWDPADHLPVDHAGFIQYALVLDALNFCFWPDDGFEYGDLARGLRTVVLNDPRAIGVDALRGMTRSRLRTWLGREVALADERVRLLREVGAGLAAHFDGSAERLVDAAGGSAARLVGLLAASFPGFRDHAIYEGRQVFFYKRAQIFAADIWGARRSAPLASHHIPRIRGVSALTTFPDYRVPQLLRELGVLRYGSGLAERVDGREAIPAGSPEEVEIRAATVVAVERLGAASARFGSERNEVAIDWWLWHRGERRRDAMRPAHRTLTVYY